MLPINRLNLIIENNLILVLLVVLSISITVLLVNYLVFGIVAIVISLLIFTYGERFLIGLIIVSLLTIVSDFGSTLRLIVHITNFSLLGFLFIKRFGLNFAEYPKVPRPILYFLGLYYSSMLISAVFSQYFLAGIFMMGRQTAFFIITYIFFSLIKDINHVKTIIISLVVVSVILSVSTVYDFSQSGTNLVSLVFGGRYRASSFIGNPDTTTAFFIITLPVVLTFALSKEYKGKRGLLVSISALIILALFLIISRSAVLSIIISLMVISFQLNRKLFIKLLLATSFFMIIIFLIEPINEAISLFFRIKSGLSQRDYFWDLAYNIIRENPLLGIGPGSYKYLEFNYAPVLLSSWPGRVIIDLNIATNGENGSHSMYLKFASDMGIPGLLSVLYFIALFFHISIVTIKKAIPGSRVLYLLILTISAALGSMFVRCIFDSIGILTYGFLTPKAKRIF
jgi:O-antigen ligase